MYEFVMLENFLKQSLIVFGIGTIALMLIPKAEKPVGKIVKKFYYSYTYNINIVDNSTTNNIYVLGSNADSVSSLPTVERTKDFANLLK